MRDNYPQWTADGRYLYYVTRKYEMREGLRRAILTTRIWDTKAGKVAGLIEGDTTGVFPFGAGPGKGTMLLTRPTLIRVHNRSYLRLAVTRPAFLHPRNKGHLQSVPQVVLHARDNKMLGDELHPLGDTSMRPIGVQGKWLLFIREDANGILNKVCIAEIMLPKKQPAR